jgi:hypothetical protein
MPKISVKTCRISGCRRQVDASGLCRPHRIREKQYGDPEAGEPLPPKIGTRVPCNVPGCRNLAPATMRLCQAHRMRLKRKGDAGLETPLYRPRGKAAQIAAQAPHYCVIDSNVLKHLLEKLVLVKNLLKTGPEVAIIDAGVDQKSEGIRVLLADDAESEAWEALLASRPVPAEWGYSYLITKHHHGSAGLTELRESHDRMKQQATELPKDSALDSE